MTETKKAILVVSFGTSYRETREQTIGAIEQTIAETFPDYEMRRAFTSQKIIRKLKNRDGEEIDNVVEALERLKADGFENVILQPTHVMSGYEYEDMQEEIAPYREHFTSFTCGKPLLSGPRDYEQMVEILTEDNAWRQEPRTAVVYLGHGTGHAAGAVYATLEDSFRAAGHFHDYIGTVEGTPSLKDLIRTVKEGDYDHVVLLPLMIVAGDHACRDMAGDEEDSWKMAFLAEGYRVTCILKGLGEYPGVRQLFADHAEAAKMQLEQ